MRRKLPVQYRRWIFALAMSGSTAMLVSAVILLLRGLRGDALLQAWAEGFLTAWPLVFAAIVFIAPRIDRLLDRVVERDSAV